MIRYRLARPDDIATCVQYIADHPVLRPRYGPAIEHLGTVWHRFLGSDALFSIVSEERGSGRARIIGAQIRQFRVRRLCNRAGHTTTQMDRA